MTLELDGLEAIEKRFADLVISQFEFVVEFAQRSLGAEEIRTAANDLQDLVIQVLKKRGIFDGSAFRVVTSEQAEPGSNPDRPYVQIGFAAEPHDFVVQLTSNRLLIGKVDVSLRTHMKELPLLREVWEELVGGPASRLRSGGLLAGRNVYRVKVGWSHELEVQGATNIQSHARLFRLEGSARGALGTVVESAEDVLRADLDISSTRQLAGRPRNLWVSYKGPYNLHRRFIDLTFQYRVGEGPVAPFLDGDVLDWDTPHQSFYYELVLQRFLPELFADIQVASRPKH